MLKINTEYYIGKRTLGNALTILAVAVIKDVGSVALGNDERSLCRESKRKDVEGHNIVGHSEHLSNCLCIEGFDDTSSQPQRSSPESDRLKLDAVVAKRILGYVGIESLNNISSRTLALRRPIPVLIIPCPLQRREHGIEQMRLVGQSIDQRLPVGSRGAKSRQLHKIKKCRCRNRLLTEAAYRAVAPQ